VFDGRGHARDCHANKVNDMKPPLSASRRRFLEFLAGVAAVHVVAIVLYYALEIERAPEGRQRLFAWGWMALTVAVVVIGLQRLKRARRADRGVPRRGAMPQ
jgi:hypothetical protein